jgi:Phosphotransferase enzyme family
LAEVLDDSPASPAGLRDLLQSLLGGPGAPYRLLGRERLAPNVYRLRFDTDDRSRSLVAKHSAPQAAWRNHLAANRWLPAIGLGASGPPLLGTADDPTGQCVWQVYEDLGDRALDERAPDPECLGAAVQAVAQIHARFAGHPLLAECRRHGADLGAGFYTASVRDAIRGLEALRSPGVELSLDRAGVRDHLLGQLHRLADEAPERTAFLREFGGPETLLHGDLWPKNVLVVPGGAGPQVRLIDWDRAGVGPVSYDLSTFLGRLAAAVRPGALNLYRQAIGRFGLHLPPLAILNRLFDTQERARLVDCVIWRARAVYEGHADWAFQELAWIEQWLGELQPVLPVGRAECEGSASHETLDRQRG